MAHYYEDFDVGDTFEFGEYTVTAEEIVDFGERYDPQPFHVDEAAAADSLFGGLVASGWHTAAICMRLFVEHLADEAWLGGRGVDELRWITPVRPGDTLSVEAEIVDKRPIPDDPTVGHVDNRLTAYRDDGEAVISWIGLGIVKRRPAVDD